MANQRYRSYRRPQTPYEDGANPEERYGVSKYFESAIRSDPSLRSSFDYSQLEEKYPIRSIASQVQLEQRRNQDRPFLEEELQYKAQLLKEREMELNLKKASRDLDLYEANLNREDAKLEQIPIARQALGQLDPRDPDFLKKSFEIQNQYPMAFEDRSFVDNIYKPLINRSNGLNRRPEKQIGITEYEEAASILQNPDLNTKAQQGDRYARVQILAAERKVAAYENQEGIDVNELVQQQGVPPQPMPAMPSEQSTPSIPQLKEGKIYKQGGSMYRYTNGQFVKLP